MCNSRRLEMKNLTLSIEEDLLLAARKLALDRGSSVNNIIREHLERLIEEDRKKAKALSRLRAMMSRGVFKVGEKTTWRREDLYEQ
jgi:hypothetical protein